MVRDTSIDVLLDSMSNANAELIHKEQIIERQGITDGARGRGFLLCITIALHKNVPAYVSGRESVSHRSFAFTGEQLSGLILTV